MVGIDAGPWEPCRQVGGRSRHVCVLHDVNIGTHMLRVCGSSATELRRLI